MLVNPIITSKGLALLAKISTNTLTLTSMGIGDGEKKISENVERLASERIKREVEFVEKQDNTIVARTTITNENIMEGFYIKEAGVYALDPDEGEILYAYTTVNGTEADYFSPGTGTVILREIIQLIIGFGNASSVSLTIDPKSVFMTAEDYEKISDPTFEDYEGGTQLPTPSVALGGIISRGKIQNLFSNIKAFLKQTVTWDKVVYNFVTNVKGYAADARCVKDLREDLDEQNQEFENLNTSLANQIGTSQGSNINLPNSFNGGLLLKELQGKSVQNGVPTPENKVDIVSVGDSGSVVARVCGKNICESRLPSGSTNGFSYTKNSDGSYTLNGTSTQESSFRIDQSSIWGSSNLKYLIKGTYTVSCIGSVNGIELIVSHYPTYNILARTTSTKTFTTGGLGDTFIYINVPSGITMSNVIIKPQLELGSVATTYEPYKEQLITIPLTQSLRSLNSVYDRGCVKSGGLWGNERNIPQVIFDGSSDEPINYYPSNASTDTELFQIGTLPSTWGVVKNCVCDRFITSISGNVWGSTNNEESFLVGGASKNLVDIRIKRSRLIGWSSSLSDDAKRALFRAWLAANPIIVQYAQGIPTFEPYSQSLQDVLNKLQSNTGVTNMFTTDPQQPILVVSYGKTDSSALALYASNVNDSKLDKSKVTASLVVTEEGFISDPRAIKTVNDKTDANTASIKELNNNLLEKANKTDIPTSLPANGGNAATVGGFTVGVSVPANAKFTDTVYNHPSTHDASMITGLPTSLPANGGNADTVGGKSPSAFANASHTHSKSEVGLGNVDNTADANKSVNYANSAGSAASANYASGAGNADTVDGIHISIVSTLPSTRDANTLYLVKG